MSGGRGRSSAACSARRAWQRSRACRSSSRSRANARWLRAMARPWPGKRSCCRRPAPMSSLFAEHPCARRSCRGDATASRSDRAARSAPWRAEDFAGAAIAVGGFDDDLRGATFRRCGARGAGVPVNVIDKPAFCDFSFGAIVNRSPLVIGISTAGAAPIFAQAIRGKLEALIPQGFAGWADAARRWRKAVQSSGLSFAARRRFWQAVRRICPGPSRAQARPIGFRIIPAPDQGRGSGCRRRQHHARRRRPRRPGAADAARNARAAVGRRHPDRRSGRPGSCSTSLAARHRDCCSAAPAVSRPANRTISQR